jgi:tetratricopeptide (TPR) repeat protein
MPWNLEHDWQTFRPVFLGGNWWYDESDNSIGYRIGPEEKRRPWSDTTWEFPGPDQYPAIAAEQKPGWTARAGEKAIYEALVSGDAYAIDLAAGEHPEFRSTADTLAGLLSLNTRRSWAGELLDRAVSSGYEPADDPFIRAYLPGAGIVVPIAPGVVVPLPLMRTAVALAAAELHQAAEEYARAIAVLEPVERTTHVTLSLTELLCAAGRYDEAVDVSDGIINVDDVSGLTLAYRALALSELGRREGAAETLDAVFNRGSRSDEVLEFARTVEASLQSPTS